MATILGLLLVVIFIASYLSTTLPSTMGQNDLQHVVQVENQVAQFGTLLQAYSAADAVGAQVSAPITLGTLGAPPFAAPDSSTITPLVNQSALTVAFTITGPSTASRAISYSTLASACNTNFCAGTGFQVQLHNTYTPTGVVAYEQGAVIYAQPTSIPVFIVAPPLTLTSKVLNLFLPQFFNSPVNPEQGTGTAELSLRTLSTEQLTFPSNGFSMLSGSSVTVTIVSPFAAGWYAYLQTVPSLSAYVACAPSTVCNELYSTNGPVGTVTVTVPVAQFQTFDLLVGTFSFKVA